MKKLIAQIGKGIVNFCVKYLGVKPYETSLMPSQQLIVETKTIQPIILSAGFDLRHQEGVTDEYIQARIAKAFSEDDALLPFIRSSVSQMEVFPPINRYRLEIAVLPKEYIETARPVRR